MATLETCNASSKLVILRSQTGSPFGAFARIPSIMLPGLFTNVPAGQLVPATPRPAASPFPLPMPEVDEPDDWTSTPKSFKGQYKQTTIDPTLVSSGPSCAVMTLKDGHSHCTNVSIQPLMSTRSH